MFETDKKVTAEHLKRGAYLYVRQSTLKQVTENTESTQRQYALREKAIALGWSEDRIIVIDNDLGQSGAQTANREGFQKLVAEVGLGNAGIVMGLEVSRLTRNSTDWHRLLEICALSNTLILDEDGIYDPSHFNSRLLLGLKGTMSETELHVLQARLRGGMLNKAKMGKLKIALPIGFVYDSEDHPVLHPDKQNAQNSGIDPNRKSPPGEGHALLQGIIICGLCGRKMTIHYEDRKGDKINKISNVYICHRLKGYMGPVCQRIPGTGIDKAIGELLTESMTPLALKVAFNVQEQLLHARLEDANNLRLNAVNMKQN